MPPLPNDAPGPGVAAALRYVLGLGRSLGPVPPDIEVEVRYRLRGTSRWAVLPVSVDPPAVTGSSPGGARRAKLKASVPQRLGILDLLAKAGGSLSLKTFCRRLNKSRSPKLGGNLSITVRAMEAEGEVARRADGSGGKEIYLTAARGGPGSTPESRSPETSETTPVR